MIREAEFMIRRAKAPAVKKKPSNGKRVPYSKTAKCISPALRLAGVLKRARARGIKPMTAEQFDRYLDECRDLWPDKAIDDFLAWLRKSRREGRY